MAIAADGHDTHARPDADGALPAALDRVARACEEQEAVAAALREAQRDAAQLRDQIRALDTRGEALVDRLQALRARHDTAVRALREAAGGADLPARAADERTDGAPAPDGAAGCRIMLIDDEPHFTALIAEYLGGRGFAVRVAPTGEHGLAIIGEFDPRIILLDLMMPGIGGMETLRRIKATRPATSVIMVTAIDDRDTARQALALGASDYITKPLTLDYLEQVLAVHVPGFLPGPPPVAVRAAAPVPAAVEMEAPCAPQKSFFARR